MQIQLAEFARGTPQGERAQEILRRCVHCGFCTATCPTYQLLGDELDGPRGRIYLIKQMLEGAEPTASTQQHLDRCLTCLNCETTCPSGVQYGKLVDIGRELAEARVPRGLRVRLWRWAVRETCAGFGFAPLLRLARALRPLLPARWRARIVPLQAPGAWPRRPHARKVLLLAGCVQRSLAPNINAATARVLDRAGIESILAAGAGCCGALRHHMNDHAAALDDARRNVDAWWPHVQSGAEAIVMNASGCGAMVREYGDLLRHDAAYAARADRIATLTRDLSELLPPLLAPLAGTGAPLQARPTIADAASPRIAFHPPCTLQHAQRIRGAVESILRSLGAEVVAFRDSHSCCGSAGTYSLLQPQLAGQLRERKLEALREAGPDLILSANLGCIAHLSAGLTTAATAPAVRHWIEWLDAELTRRDRPDRCAPIAANSGTGAAWM